jgi:alpha-beta hydrolase superfamily lysophospholipase
MTHRRIERVYRTAVGGGRAALAATVHLPAAPDPARPVLFLFPGATYARGYFDLRPDGFAGYSEAEHHVAQGMVAVAIDHVGTGDSPYDGPLTLADMAQACDGATRAALAELRAGALDPAVPPLPCPAAVGVGQSMGGFVVVAAQAAYETFDAIAALGSSFTQTRLALKPGRRYPPRDADIATVMAAVQEDCDMLASFHCAGTPRALVEADFAPGLTAPWRSAAVPDCVRDLMRPGIMAREAAAVRAPVFLGYGEVDVTPEPLADVGAFRSTADISLLVAPGMAHMHNFAPTRRILWRRLTRFAEAAAETVADRRAAGTVAAA